MEPSVEEYRCGMEMIAVSVASNRNRLSLLRGVAQLVHRHRVAAGVFNREGFTGAVSKNKLRRLACCSVLRHGDLADDHHLLLLRVAAITVGHCPGFLEGDLWNGDVCRCIPDDCANKQDERRNGEQTSRHCYFELPSDCDIGL